MTNPRLGCGLGIVAAVYAAVFTQPVRSDGQAMSADTPRTDHAVGFYDVGLRAVVLVGGTGDPKPGDRDTAWKWSGTRWELLTDAGPAGRVNAGAAYEARRGRAIVAGGSRRTADGATWEVVGDSWEGDRRGWRPIASIPPRDHQSLVEDGRGGVLMYGGIPADRSGPWPTDTWELRGDTWSRIAIEGPAGRGRTALTYDSRHRQVVLFGGVSAPPGPNQEQTFFGDTWLWDGRGWRLAADRGPRGRYAHAIAFDERAGVVLLYGGAAAHRDAPLSDMWQWDGERWTEIPLDGPTPGHRYQPVMVYDRARDRTVLYGGIGGPGDTWEWNGRRWQQISPWDGA
jgi:hypothetical protein